jgi:hypothetical protein
MDSKERGKIGVTPRRSLGNAGSYDPETGRMTLLVYDPPEEYAGYVNSMWELQDNPFSGDAINSYNDGLVDESGKLIVSFTNWSLRRRLCLSRWKLKRHMCRPSCISAAISSYCNPFCCRLPT